MLTFSRWASRPFFVFCDLDTYEECWWGFVAFFSLGLPMVRLESWAWRGENHTNEVHFSHHSGFRGISQTFIIGAGSDWQMSPLRVSFSPSTFRLLGVSCWVQFTLRETGTKPHHPQGRASKNLWTQVKVTTEINKYLEGRLCRCPLSPTPFSIHRWILPAAITTVVR